MELNELIYVAVELACGKLRVLQKNTSKHSKTGWEIRLETISDNKKKNARIYLDEKSKATRLQQKVQLEEMNQKILAKEGRLRRCWDRIKQYRQNRTFQTMKERTTC